MIRLPPWRLLLALLFSCGGSTQSFTTPTTGDGGTCTDTWSSFGSTFFPNTCGGCHGGMSTHASVTSSRSTLRSVIASGRMPPSGLSWTDEQRVVLYLDCGAP